VFRAERTQKASVIRPHEFLDDPAPAIETENVDEIHRDARAIGRQRPIRRGIIVLEGDTVAA